MRLALAFVLALAGAGPAAAELVLPGAPIGAARLVEGWRDADGGHVAAIEIRLPPGWHTYWRVPGEAGIPPLFDWTGSRNLRDVHVVWPTPELYDAGGQRTLVYMDGVILPVVLRPETPGAPIVVTLDLSYGVCREICAPQHQRLTLRIDGEGAPADRAQIAAALAARPLDAAEAGVTGARCALAPGAEGHDVTAAVELGARPGADAVVVIEAADRPDLWIGWPRVWADGSTLMAEAPLVPARGSAVALDRAGIRVTVLDGRQAIDIPGCAVD